MNETEPITAQEEESDIIPLHKSQWMAEPLFVLFPDPISLLGHFLPELILLDLMNEIQTLSNSSSSVTFSDIYDLTWSRVELSLFFPLPEL